MTNDKDSAVLEHKMGWCFSCDTNQCLHIQNANAELRAALEARGLEIREKGND